MSVSVGVRGRNSGLRIGIRGRTVNPSRIVWDRPEEEEEWEVLIERSGKRFLRKDGEVESRAEE